MSGQRATRSAADDARPPRRVLAVASGGGHFKQLVRLMPRLEHASRVTLVTHDTGVAEDALRTAGTRDDLLGPVRHHPLGIVTVYG